MLRQERDVLLRRYAEVQVRCSALLAERQAALDRAEADVMRLRAECMVRITQWAIERDRRLAMEDAAPGLPRRLQLLQVIENLRDRVQVLTRERLRHQLGARTVVQCPSSCQSPGTGLEAPFASHGVQPDPAGGSDAESLPDTVLFEASLRAADMVICQTGCISHGDYWRIQDHCKRTGKVCVMVTDGEPEQFVMREEPGHESV